MLFLEFDRLGVPTDFGAGFCTFLATREKLLAACHRYGIELPQQHRALADARATANLAMRLIDEETCKQLTNARIGHVPHALNPRTLRRMDEAEVSDMARIVSHSTFPHSDEAILHYLDALDWVLDDQHIDDQERSEMNQLAEDLGISDSARRQAHRSYLTSIIAAAERDGVVTDAEEHLIKQIMRALDLAEVELPTVTNLPQATSFQAGMRVCFTGTVVVAGVEFSRARLEEFASQLGMQPVSGVTKKRCDLLVAADTSSGSGKARQAKKFGIPIVSATTFVNRWPWGHLKDRSDYSRWSSRQYRYGDRDHAACGEIPATSAGMTEHLSEGFVGKS